MSQSSIRIRISFVVTNRASFLLQKKNPTEGHTKNKSNTFHDSTTAFTSYTAKGPSQSTSITVMVTTLEVL